MAFIKYNWICSLLCMRIPKNHWTKVATASKFCTNITDHTKKIGVWVGALDPQILHSAYSRIRTVILRNFKGEWKRVESCRNVLESPRVFLWNNSRYFYGNYGVESEWSVSPFPNWTFKTKQICKIAFCEQPKVY